MNVKRFTARTSRDALNLVRQALGDDAVVLSTKPCPEGVEVLAMAPESIEQIERIAAPAPQPMARPAARPAAAAPAKAAPAARPAAQAEVQKDVEQLAMSTLSFQDYVRERMLKRREAAMKAEAPQAEQRIEPEMSPLQAKLTARMNAPTAAQSAPMAAAPVVQAPAYREPPTLREEVRHAAPAPIPAHVPSLADVPHDAPRASHRASDEAVAAQRREQEVMMTELRSMKGLIEERFGALAFMEKLQRQPGQARLTQKLLDCGFSPALIRKLAESLSPDVSDENAWAAGVLERNLMTGEAEAALEDQGGVYALIGSTGVGKTTSTAKLAAAFATKYGAANLGLVTLDAYRVGAHEQLRAYGRILGVPVHTAHDRASLEDLLELLAAKKMVLIDTAGMAQRDSRTRELLDMLGHRSIQKLLVVNAAQQGETIEDVLVAYRASLCRGVILSKMDEAVKLGPAIDALIRHKLSVVGVANGQRVPEDWHRLSAHALVHRALRPTAGTAYRMDVSDMNLIFAAPQGRTANHGAAHL
ncbi:flagellar biosynthesis protein FlhF [Piscinibacter terrae]|uniref:Flagellar biosynthesis protein FlhF n=1 Tax=Piscinibacter terrae TaxID=2496871 RepID=A0A3N7HW59_9BURK|nr:flagellar biosynthesis protein FlhF [Albitalea terrae]RQP25231.1 flagellar biosynthesis protein FlhF [Albitalea terrae]